MHGLVCRYSDGVKHDALPGLAVQFLGAEYFRALVQRFCVVRIPVQLPVKKVEGRRRSRRVCHLPALRPCSWHRIGRCRGTCGAFTVGRSKCRNQSAGSSVQALCDWHPWASGSGWLTGCRTSTDVTGGMTDRSIHASLSVCRRSSI